MPLSAYLDQKILEKAFLGVDFTIAARWISVHTDDPGKTGLNEAAGAFYGRIQITTFTAVDTVGDDKRTRNDTAASVQVNAGTYTHAGLWDAETSGNFLGGGLLSSPVTLDDGDFVIVDQYNLSVLLD